MAEVTTMRNNAMPYPIYGLPFVITYPFLDADGDPVSGATTPDAEISKNGDTFADCTNESTEIATNSGIYYLSLTATELTTDVATIQAKSATSGMKTTVATLYPRKLVSVRSGTTQGGSSTTIQFDSSASTIDDFYNGMVVAAVLDGTTEVRLITDYTGSTKTATVHVAWISGDPGPDSNDTFTIYLPEGRHVQESNTTYVNGIATSSVAAVGAYIGNATAAISVDASGRLDVAKLAGSATPVTNIGTVYNTDFATNYDATNKAWLSKLGNFAMGGSSLNLSLGTLSTSGTATLNALTVTNATTLSGAVSLGSTLGITGAITATNASNDLRGILLQATQTGVTIPTVTTLTNAPSDSSGTTTLLSRLTAVRAALLDRLRSNYIVGVINTVSSQTSFTLTGGPSHDSDLVGWTVVFYDGVLDPGFSSPVAALVSAYTSSTGTVTLSSAPSRTISSNDVPYFIAPNKAVTSDVTTALTTALTEGYRGTNSTGSVRDLLYETIAHLGECSISSTTKTLKKIDGATTAKTYTLNSSTTPTSITETT